MIKHKRMGLAAVLLMSAAVLFLAIVYMKPALFAAVAGAADMPYAAEMDKSAILRVEIVADETDWQHMLDNATAEEYITATVTINGRRLENVGIRPKGNSSLSQVARDDSTDRYSFKIEFDHYISGQTWLGLDKLAINNMQGDATYMKEYLSYDILSYAGVETPLYAFASISVNGEEWGFYLAIEALEDSFAERVFGNAHGMLYKPEGMGGRGNGQMDEFINNMMNENAGEMQFPQEMQMPQEGQFPRDAANGERAAIGGRGDFGGGGGFGGMGGMGGMSGGTTLQYIDDEIASYDVIFGNAIFDAGESDFRRLINALKKLNNGEDLDSVVDVEATLKYFAAHTVVVNLDSYVSSMCHNYYLYEKNGQLTMLPWDYNLSFGGFQTGSASSIVNFPIDTPVSGTTPDARPMLGKLLEVPEYLELYHGYLREIVDGYFDSGLFAQTMDALEMLISPYVQADVSAFYSYEAYEAGLAELRELGLLRAESIRGQLEGSIPATTEGQNADPSALIDASGINIAALGNMGGGGFGGGGFGGAWEGMDGMEGGGFGGGAWDGAEGMEGGGFGGGARQMAGRSAFMPETVAAETEEGGYDRLLIAICMALPIAGLAFVMFFRRRGAS